MTIIFGKEYFTIEAKHVVNRKHVQLPDRRANRKLLKTMLRITSFKTRAEADDAFEIILDEHKSKFEISECFDIGLGF